MLPCTRVPPPWYGQTFTWYGKPLQSKEQGCKVSGQSDLQLSVDTAFLYYRGAVRRHILPNTLPSFSFKPVTQSDVQ